MSNQKLIDFIKEALINHKWPLAEVESAFSSLLPKYTNKNQVTLFLSDELISVLEKRSKKNMFTMSEQIEDILRRSTINQTKKKSPYDAKLDDTLVSIFSRKRTGPKK